MLWKDTLKLSNDTEAVNANGFEVESTGTQKTIFCNARSIGRSEFYNASMANMKVSIEFECMSCDYNNETDIEFNGKEYKVERTYSSGVDRIFLICSDASER